MAGIFMKCANLKYLNLANYKTNNVKIREFISNEWKRLIKLNLSSFDTINAINMKGFIECNNIVNINLFGGFLNPKFKIAIFFQNHIKYQWMQYI